MQDLTLFSFRLAFVTAQVFVLTQIERDLYHYTRRILLANGCNDHLLGILFSIGDASSSRAMSNSFGTSYSQTYLT
jgi:hypothetical protein